MSTYSQKHADLFRTVADILVSDYIAPGVTEETVAEWCENAYVDCDIPKVTRMEPSKLAALIAKESFIKEIKTIIAICDGTMGPEDWESGHCEQIQKHAEKALGILSPDK